MATLHKRKDGAGRELPYWYCSFRIPSGDGWKQVQRCTKQRTKKEATEAARRMERDAMAEAGAGEEKSAALFRLVKEAGELAARDVLNGDRARAIVGKILELSTGEKLAEYTVRGWLQGWVEGKKATVASATHSRYKNAIKRFLEHLGAKAEARLETLTLADVRGFRDGVKEDRGTTSKTANGYAKDVRSGLEAAVREGVLLRNPADNLESLPEDDSTDREPFSVAEVSDLLDAATSQDWRGVILLGAYGGLRLGDASRLKAGNVDLPEGVVKFMPSKTKRKKKIVTLPLHAELVAFFEKHPLGDDIEGPVFPALAKVSLSGRKGLSSSFGKIMEAAGVARKAVRLTEDGAARNQYARGFHSLRHTFNSLMANADVAQETRMKLTGHASREVNDIYTHSEVEALRRAVEAVPGLGN